MIFSMQGETQPFGTLDEIMALYISPMNDLVSELMKHKAFEDIDVEEAKPLLEQRSLG